jgi:hypothetical protein
LVENALRFSTGWPSTLRELKGLSSSRQRPGIFGASYIEASERPQAAIGSAAGWPLVGALLSQPMELSICGLADRLTCRSARQRCRADRA